MKMIYRYKKKLIKLGNSKAIVLPMNFLKKFPDAKEILIEEYPNKLIIKAEL